MFMINGKFKEYTMDQVNKACEEGKIVHILFLDDEIITSPVVLEKHTAKMLFIKSGSSDKRFEKAFVGFHHYNGCYVIQGDEWEVAEIYYRRMQEKILENVEQLQCRFKQMSGAIDNKRIRTR
jgi:hypothetical protein